MDSAKRPNQIAILKNDATMSGENQMEPWAIITTTVSECEDNFDVPQVAIPTTPDAVVCETYPTGMLNYEEIVTFDAPSSADSVSVFWLKNLTP